MNKIKNYKKIVVITLSFLLMFSLVIPSTQNNVFAEGQETPVEEKTEDSELTENVDNDELEKDANDEDKQDEQTEEVEDDTVEEEGENITNEITEPSQSLGEYSNRSSRATPVVGIPSLEAVNAAIPSTTGQTIWDRDTGLRFSLLQDPNSGAVGAIIEPGNPMELVRNPDGGINIPDKLAGYPLVGIRKEAFKNRGLKGEIKFTMENESGSGPRFYVGDYAFANNEIEKFSGFPARTMLANGRAGTGIFMNNKISDISIFLRNLNSEVDYYSIPTLAFANNNIVDASFASPKVVKHIGVMAFANNQIERMSSVAAFREGVTIYSGAFYNNKITTDVINALPDNIVFSTDTTDIFGGNSKTLNADGSVATTPYSEGLGAFQKNLLTTVPTVKAGWKFGYRTFAANNITGDLVFNTALMNASASSEGLFIANPITGISFPDLSGVTSTQAEIPKEFLARKTSANTNFRECPDVEMLSGHVLEYFNPVKNTANKVVPRIIKEGAFRGTNIKEIRYLRYTKEIEKEAFAYCTDLETLGLRLESNQNQAVSALYHVYTIGEKAFYQCAKLSGDIGLSASVDIGKYAFAMTDNVTDTYDSSIVSPPPISFFTVGNDSLLVPWNADLARLSVGEGAFAYRKISTIRFHTKHTNDNGPFGTYYVTNILNFEMYAFAYCGIKSLGSFNHMSAFKSKSFIGNHIFYLEPSPRFEIAPDAFMNQSSTGYKFKKGLYVNTGQYTIDLTYLLSEQNGLNTMKVERIEAIQWLDSQQQIVNSGGVSWDTTEGFKIFTPNMMPSDHMMRLTYRLIAPTGSGSGNNIGVHTIDLKEIEYWNEVELQIGNNNNSNAWFGSSSSTKTVLEELRSGGRISDIPTSSENTMNLSLGYALGGWYTNPECTGEPVDITAPQEDPIRLYAKIVESIDLTLHSGTNAEFGSIGSGVREKILKVPEGSTVRETFDAMSEEERNQWNLAFDNTSQENSEMKRVGEWFTTNTFVDAYYDGAPITNAYDMDAVVTDATPKNLYADVDKLKEITFHSVAPPNVSRPHDYVFYSGEFESKNSGIVSKIMTVRYGKVLKSIFESMPESEFLKWEIKYDTRIYDKISYQSSPWVTSGGSPSQSYYALPIEGQAPTDLYPMILKGIESIRMHSGAFAEFGAIGSGVRELEFKIYEGKESASLSDIMILNSNRPSIGTLMHLAYDESSYELASDFYTNPQFTTAINELVPYNDTYGYSDIYIRLTPLTIEDVIIPDPDSLGTPMWGVEVPREVVLEKDREMDIKTKLVSLTGYEESIGTDLNVDLYIRSQNGMRLKREDLSSTEELKYRVLLGNASLGGVSVNQGMIETLVGTFTSTNRTIEGNAKVLEDGLVMDHYKDNLIFKIQRRVMP